MGQFAPVAGVQPLKVYVGYDSREDIAWQVCRHSIERHMSSNVAIHSLRQPELRNLGLYTRPGDSTASTEFSLTRFLTPYIAGHDGWSLFVDCDFLFTRDITELLKGLDPRKAVYVVKHDYVPASAMKMDGKVQTTYPRKNWSSFMLFNGAHSHVKKLTPDFVNQSSPQHLHRFEWLPDEDMIGALDVSWNFLVGEYPIPDEKPAAIHFTNGGPWFSECGGVEFSDLWLEEQALYFKSHHALSR
ncbi:glycosyltransferase [Brevundimonas sp. Leaf363]|nr:glycosyltransferase [Brevundimonas sp. Leaf363]